MTETSAIQEDILTRMGHAFPILNGMVCYMLNLLLEVQVLFIVFIYN